MKIQNAVLNAAHKILSVFPHNQNRHASGNNIYTSTFTLIKKIPVIRYVCCDCGYVENWVETKRERDEIKRTFG